MYKENFLAIPFAPIQGVMYTDDKLSNDVHAKNTDD